jgi:mannose-1-phosphate guanylyltransferase
VIPSSFGWSDLGTWGSAYENLEKDYHDNAVAGNNIILFDSSKNIVHTTGDKLVLLQGLDGFIVVDTKDALLVCRKENEQNIKEYLTEIKRNKGDKYL